MFLAKRGCYCSHVLVMIFLRHPWLFCSICVVLICGFAWLSCRGEYLSPYPHHQPLFSSHGKVHEITNGSLEVLSRFLHATPLKFVLFYAPWCGQSRKVAPEFRRAANALYDKVTFIAINCWTGTCRKENTLDAFPKLYAYHTNFPGLQYPEAFGYHSTHMLRFLQGVVRPFVYSGREDDLNQLFNTEQEVVVSYFEPCELGGKKYSLLFTVALSHVGKVSTPKFAVVTNKQVADNLGLNATGDLAFHRAFHPIITYHPEKSTTAPNVSDWIASNRKQLVVQLTPNAAITDELASQLNEKAALILFLPTRRRKLAALLLRLFTQAALDYHNCTCNKTSATNTARQQDKKLVEIKTEEIRPTGPEIPKTSPKILEVNSARSICRSLVIQKVENQPQMHNVCDICHRCRNGCSRNHDDIFDVIQARLLSSNELVPRPCSTILTSYHPSSLVTSVCCSGLILDKNAKKKSIDSRSYENKLNNLIDNIFENILTLKGLAPLKESLSIAGIKGMLREETQKIKELSKEAVDQTPTPARQTPKAEVYPVNDTMADKVIDGCNRTGHVMQFLGASCHSNRSVNFFYMDSDMYGTVADRLGVVWRAGSAKVALVIADIKNEAQYVMSEDKPLTNETLVDFVMAYMNSRLQRTLRTPPPVVNTCPPGRACIVEVTTANFDEIVIDNDKDVLLVFYASWCGMCINLAPVILTVARFFKDIDQLRIARIDADQNDLSWNLTVPSYPTLILFAAGRKDSSVRLPANAERTATRIIEFVDEHGSEALRNALYGNTDSYCETVAIKARLRQLESRLQRVEQEKKLLETRLEAAMVDKALAAFEKLNAMKGMREVQQRLTREREARVTAERVHRESEASRKASEERLFQIAVENAQLELELEQRAKEAVKNDETFVELLEKTKLVISERQKLSNVMNDATRELNELKTSILHLKKRELFLSQKVQRLERTSQRFAIRNLEHLVRYSKNEKEITELKRERELMTQLMRGAENTVSGLQASLSSANQMLDDVTRERNRAVETGNELKRQLEEMKGRYDQLSELLRNVDIPKRRRAR